LIFIGAMLAAGGGLGGGGIFVPLYILVVRLSPYDAIPLSQVSKEREKKIQYLFLSSLSPPFSNLFDVLIIYLLFHLFFWDMAIIGYNSRWKCD